MMTGTSVESVGSIGGCSEAGGDQERRVKLHRKLKRIARARALLDTHEAAALREAQRLQLWKQFGYTSLVDYMDRELGYAPRAALDRLRVANALPELPAIAEAMETGALDFSKARELVRVATPETEQAWIGAVQDKNVREVERVVAGHAKGDLPDDPVDPRLVRKTMWLSVRPETEVLFREARKRLERERGETLDDDAVMEALCRAFLGGTGISDETRADAGANEIRAHVDTKETHATTSAGAAPYRVAVTICTQCKRGWQHGAGAVEEMTPAAVERAECDAQRIGDVSSGNVERATQTIPPATRRKVLHRDQGRCQVPGCSSHTNLDVHHVVHREHGGTHEMSNLVTLCEAHHLAHHEGTLVISRNAAGGLAFHREGRNRFTRATREHATKQALRQRGFDREQVKTIIARTIHHVGETSLSADQWLAIALRYADDSSS
jgi:hypothetical protein